MLHFVTSYMKQTLESAQNGLEIIFNIWMEITSLFHDLFINTHVTLVKLGS